MLFSASTSVSHLSHIQIKKLELCNPNLSDIFFTLLYFIRIIWLYEVFTNVRGKQQADSPGSVGQNLPPSALLAGEEKD